MADNPFTPPSLSGFNSNPPSDDGSEVSDNEITWAKHLTKLATPLKTFAEAIVTNVTAAFNSTINTGDDQDNQMTGSLAFGSSELTLASDSVAATRTYHTIDTEADAAADDLSNITTASVSDGAILRIKAQDASHVVTAKHEAGGAGQLHLRDEADVVLDDLVKSIWLYRDGADWYEFGHKQTNAFSQQLFHAQDEKTQNTDGGTFTLGSWQTRTINTEKTNEIADVSLSSNQVSLPAGTYYAEFSAPANEVNGHQARLQDVTNATTLIVGTSEFASQGSQSVQTRSFGCGRFTLAGTASIELQHQSTATQATTGFGDAANFTTEVYSIVKIWRVG